MASDSWRSSVVEPLTGLLRRSLALVERRRPDAHADLATSLAGLRLGLMLEEALVLAVEHGALREVTHPGVLDIRVRTDRSTVRALVRGRTTLTAAIRTDAIELVGAPDALARALRAFECFAGALLRIDEAEELCEALED
jgi:hypothetical protein